MPSLPLMAPSPQAHYMAETAHSLTLITQHGFHFRVSFPLPLYLSCVIFPSRSSFSTIFVLLFHGNVPFYPFFQKIQITRRPL